MLRALGDVSSVTVESCGLNWTFRISILGPFTPLLSVGGTFSSSTFNSRLLPGEVVTLLLFFNLLSRLESPLIAGVAYRDSSLYSILFIFSRLSNLGI